MEQRNFLKSSKCDRDGRNVFVCCPSTFTIDDLPTGKQCGVQASDKSFGNERAALADFPWYEFNLSVNELLNLFAGCKINEHLFYIPFSKYENLAKILDGWTGWH